MDFTDLVADAGVVEDPLGGRRLPRIDVGHDADVAGAFERDGAWHGCEPAGAEALPAVVGESLVGLRHAVGVLLLLHGAAAAVGLVVHHRVHELRHRPILVLRIGQHLSPLDLAFTWHGYGTLRLWPDGDLPSRRTPFVHFGLFAPYFERP